MNEHGKIASSFAMIDTPSGFPMPEMPKTRSSRTKAPDCQETDVDIFVGKIIRQGNWTSKVFDKDVVQQWAKWGRADTPRRNRAALAYAVKECRWRQAQWNNRVGTPVAYCKAGIVLARDGVSEDLCSAIMKGVRTLQSDHQGDEGKPSTVTLHPKYKRIQHLVHPSLYAYEKGVTHILKEANATRVSAPSWETFLGVQGVANDDIPYTEVWSDPRYWYHRFEMEPPTLAESSHFQWLPSEFFVSSAASPSEKATCQINSYINNLHPVKYRGLYDKIGELFVESLPLLEEVLSEINDCGRVRKQLPRFWSRVRKSSSWRPSPPKANNFWELPLPFFRPPKFTGEKKAVYLHDRLLQVIFKLVSMELQPDQKSDDLDSMTSEERYGYRLVREKLDHHYGGHWHVEGTHDERIVATACCYLESVNVKEGGLYFRDGSEGSGGEELGVCSTFSGRILAWPNYLHHKTGSVSLKDKSQPGHHTLCCFHLVDPTLRIRSTATVPPQQESWVNEMIDETVWSRSKSESEKQAFRDACLVIKDGSTIDYEEALDRHKRLSEERSGDAGIIADNYFVPLE